MMLNYLILAYFEHISTTDGNIPSMSVMGNGSHVQYSIYRPTCMDAYMQYEYTLGIKEISPMVHLGKLAIYWTFLKIA